MSAAIAIARFFLLSVAASTLLGCTFRPNIVSAHAHKIGDNKIIEIEMNLRDVSVIKSRQMYFSIVVVECEENGIRFPMEPYISGQRAVEFKFPVAGQYVKITGVMPVSIFDKYRHPCVFLEGGGYFFGKVHSANISVVKDGEN